MSTNQPGPGTAGKPKSDGMALLKQYGPPAVLLILLVWFVLANSQSVEVNIFFCLLFTSPSPRDRTRSRMPSSA
mgnify:CR=1 FL=1